MRSSRQTLARWAVVAVLAVSAASCAKKVVVPAAPAVAKYPDFLVPTVPAALQRTPGAERMDLGWRYLQVGDLDRADAVFGDLVKARPEFYPARAGQGYAAMARGQHARALTEFDGVLSRAAGYVPALVGKGQALVALSRDGDALAAFEAAQAADPSLGLGNRIEVLRLRRVQTLVEAARTTARTGTPDQARAAYESAIAASPESGFLYRELAAVELRDGRTDPALERLRKAVDLDSTDAQAWVEIGDLLAKRGDRPGAQQAYRAASDADPGLDLTERIAAVTEAVATAAIRPELAAIPGTEQITRGDLAALIADRLGYVLTRATARQEVVTDTRGHWAADAIAQVVRAGVVEPFANHTFQPRGRLRRADLAFAASRLVALLPPAARPAVAGAAARPAIADMVSSHLDYPAASRALAAGVMSLVDGRFYPARAVSGREAGETLERVRQLAERAGVRP